MLDTVLVASDAHFDTVRVDEPLRVGHRFVYHTVTRIRRIVPASNCSEVGTTRLLFRNRTSHTKRTDVSCATIGRV